MSDELSKLERQLWQATAPDAATDAPLDDETALLREGWLAFGQLLEDARPSSDEPFELRPMPRRGSFARRKLVLAVAVAASLLVAATLAWQLGGSWLPVGPLPATEQIARPNTEQPNSERRAPVVEEPQTELAADELKWDDSLDEQIVSIGREVVRVQQDWNGLGNAFSTVDYGLGQIEQDMEDNTL